MKFQFITILIPAVLLIYGVNLINAQSYREDINGDGSVAINDAISLILLGSAEPGNPLADYNSDGAYGITDAISLIIAITRGTRTPLEPVATEWTRLGPGGGGAQFLPTINPSDPYNVVLRCDMTGSYVTTDNAQSWKMYNLRTVVQDFEFDPSDPSTVYAASSAIYRSQDKGQNWELIFPSPDDIIREHMAGDHAEEWLETTAGLPGGENDLYYSQICVDPSDGNNIWITRTSSYGDTPHDILASNDYGASWNQVAQLNDEVIGIFPGSWWNEPSKVLVVGRSSAMIVDRDSGGEEDVSLPGSWLSAVTGGSSEGDVVLYALDSDIVYKSTDIGETWTSVNNNFINQGEYNTIATCESNPEIIYLACSYQQNYHFGIIKSENGGASWNWNLEFDNSGTVSGNYSEGWLDRDYGPSWREAPFSLGVYPNDPDICYGSDYGGTIRTLDGGTGWEEVYTNKVDSDSYSSRGLDVTTLYDVAFDPSDTQKMFVSYTDVGAFRSEDGGSSWIHSINGIPANWRNTCYSAVYDPTVENLIWSAWGSAHDLPRHKMFRNGFSGKQGGVAVSVDGGASWSASNSGIPYDAVCTHISLDPSSPEDARVIYVNAFRKGVYKTSDGGSSWSKLADIPGDNPNNWRLCLLPDGTLFVLVARNRSGSVETDGGLYRSNDGGGSWEKIILPEGVNFPNDMVYAPPNPSCLYLSCWPWSDVIGELKGGWKVLEKGGGLLMSEDKGESWSRIFRENAHVYAAAVDPRNSDILYINTFDSAAFMSDDRGQNWHTIDGYSFKWGHRPVPDPYNPGMLYLTTFGGGLWYGPAAAQSNSVANINNFNLDWRWQE